MQTTKTQRSWAAVALGGVIGLAGVVRAAPVVDGTKDAEYGAIPNALQTIGTGFGDNQSELDNAYGIVEGGNLYLFLGGNLESNFNKMEIFIDSNPLGGQNKLRGDNPNIDFNGLNRMGDDPGTAPVEGLAFDAAFAPDHYITFGRNTTDIFVNYAQLLAAGGGTGAFLGQVATPNANQQGSGTVGQAGFPTVTLGYSDANVAGVSGAQGAADANGNTAITGAELQISLADLGNPIGPIGISVFINGGGHDFLSNQILGPAPVGTNNLGEPRFVNFNELNDGLVGPQFFLVPVPEPMSVGVMAMAVFAVVTRRRAS